MTVNCFTLISLILSIPYAKYSFCVHSRLHICIQLCLVEPWINKHKISMVTTQETGKECTLLEGQEKLDILNLVDAT